MGASLSEAEAEAEAEAAAAQMEEYMRSHYSTQYSYEDEELEYTPLMLDTKCKRKSLPSQMDDEHQESWLKKQRSDADADATPFPDYSKDIPLPVRKDKTEIEMHYLSVLSDRNLQRQWLGDTEAPPFPYPGAFEEMEGHLAPWFLDQITRTSSNQLEQEQELELEPEVEPELDDNGGDTPPTQLGPEPEYYELPESGIYISKRSAAAEAIPFLLRESELVKVVESGLSKNCRGLLIMLYAESGGVWSYSEARLTLREDDSGYIITDYTDDIKYYFRETIRTGFWYKVGTQAPPTFILTEFSEALDPLQQRDDEQQQQQQLGGDTTVPAP